MSYFWKVNPALMLQLLKSKIESLKYTNPYDLEKLLKYVAISKFIFKDKSRDCSPPYEECFIAIDELNAIELKERNGTNEVKFNEIKTETLDVLNKLILFFKDIDRTNLSDILMGKTRAEADKEIKFALLEVEQNNIVWFKERTSHLPSEPHDRLASHTWMYGDSAGIKIGFIDGSELPTYIKDQVSAAFLDATKRFSGNTI